jgi:hypothetical protein
LLRSASTTRSEAEEVGDQYNRHPTPTRALLLPFLLVGSVGDGGGDDGEAGAMACGGVLAAGWLPALLRSQPGGMLAMAGIEHLSRRAASRPDQRFRGRSDVPNSLLQQRRQQAGSQWPRQ